MPIVLKPYMRQAAVDYAHRWAYSRNPVFYNYEEIGGDCTNFASQCLYAGSGVMNFTPDFGWYYINGNNKAPAWTGVEYLYQFLTRQDPSVGPAAVDARIMDLMPGDLIQLSFDGETFSHTPVVVAADRPRTPSEVLVAAHSYDSDNRPLSSYTFQKIRYLHIVGVQKPAWSGSWAPLA